MNPPGSGFVSPRSFSLKQRISLVIVPSIIATSLKLMASSCRSEVRGSEHLERVFEQYGRVIAAFWHESLTLAALHYRNEGYHTLTSYSFDGELAARTLRRFGLQAVRGSSSEGGMDALAQLQRTIETVQLVGLTVDGPKGPRHVVKPGVAILSVRAGIPILPVAFAAWPAWRLNSWDRTMIPKPFGRIITAYGSPIVPPEGRRPRGVLEAVRLSVETELNKLHDDLEQAE